MAEQLEGQDPIESTTTTTTNTSPATTEAGGGDGGNGDGGTPKSNADILNQNRIKLYNDIVNLKDPVLSSNIKKIGFKKFSNLLQEDKEFQSALLTDLGERNFNITNEQFQGAYVGGRTGYAFDFGADARAARDAAKGSVEPTSEEDSSILGQIKGLAKETYKYAKDTYNEGAAFIKRGWYTGLAGRGAQAENFAMGNVDTENLAKYLKKADEIGTQKIEAEFAKDETFLKDADDLIAILVPSVMESFANMAGAGYQKLIGGTAAGAGVGAATGGLPGAVIGGGKGLQYAMLQQGYNLEFTGTVIDELQTKGLINLQADEATLKKQLDAAFADKKLMAPIYEKANTRALAITGTDFVLSGMGGRVLKNLGKSKAAGKLLNTPVGQMFSQFAEKTVSNPVYRKAARLTNRVAELDKKIAGSKLGKAGATIGVADMFGGGAGETLAQYLTQDELDWKSIGVEIGAEGKFINMLRKLGDIGQKKIQQKAISQFATEKNLPPNKKQAETVADDDWKPITEQEYDDFKKGKITPEKVAGLMDDVDIAMSNPGHLEKVAALDELYGKMVKDVYEMHLAAVETKDLYDLALNNIAELQNKKPEEIKAAITPGSPSFNEKIANDFKNNFNVLKQQYKEKNDSENASGLSSEVGKGQKPQQAQSEQGASEEETGDGGVLEAAAAEERIKEIDEFLSDNDQYFKDHGENILSQEELDDLLQEKETLLKSQGGGAAAPTTTQQTGEQNVQVQQGAQSAGGVPPQSASTEVAGGVSETATPEGAVSEQPVVTSEEVVGETVPEGKGVEVATTTTETAPTKNVLKKPERGMHSSPFKFDEFKLGVNEKRGKALGHGVYLAKQQESTASNFSNVSLQDGVKEFQKAVHTEAEGKGYKYGFNNPAANILFEFGKKIISENGKVVMDITGDIEQDIRAIAEAYNKKLGPKDKMSEAQKEKFATKEDIDNAVEFAKKHQDKLGAAYEYEIEYETDGYIVPDTTSKVNTLPKEILDKISSHSADAKRLVDAAVKNKNAVFQDLYNGLTSVKSLGSPAAVSNFLDSVGIIGQNDNGQILIYNDKKVNVVSRKEVSYAEKTRQLKAAAEKATSATTSTSEKQKPVAKEIKNADVEVRKGKTHDKDGVYEAVYKGKVIGKFSFDKKEKVWVDASGDKFAQKKDAISKFVLQYNMANEAAAETSTAKGEGKGKAAPTGKAEPAPTKTETKGETKPTGKAEPAPTAKSETAGAAIPSSIQQAYARRATLRMTAEALQKQMGGKKLGAKAQKELDTVNAEIAQLDNLLNAFEKEREKQRAAKAKAEQTSEKKETKTEEKPTTLVGGTVKGMAYGNYLINQLVSKDPKGEESRQGYIDAWNAINKAQENANKANSFLEDILVGMMPADKKPTAYADIREGFKKQETAAAPTETKGETKPTGKTETKPESKKEEKSKWIGKSKEQYVSDRVSEILATTEGYEKKVGSKDKADQKVVAYYRDEANKKAEQEYDKLFNEALVNKTLPNEYKPNYLLTSSEKVAKDKKRYTADGYPQNHDEKLSKQEHKEEVQSAVDNGLYVKAIEQGILTYDEASKIIESAGVKVAENVESTAKEEKATSAASTAKLPSFSEFDAISEDRSKMKEAKAEFIAKHGQLAYDAMKEISANFTKITKALQEKEILTKKC